MAQRTKLALRERRSEETLAAGKAGAIRMLPAIPAIARMASQRWGVILAGGDGVRLRPLTQIICGDDRPKQFCPLFNGETLLQQTLRRSQRSIPPEQLLVSLTRHHRRWYSQQAELLPSQRVVQPANRGTALPILHSLLSLAELDEQALVGILPCDHHYSDEGSFTSALDYAFEIAGERTDSVVLLGARPNYPEVEYGWIELGEPVGHAGRELFRVRAFQEKPVIDVARKLLEQGSVWNTFVMVGHVQAFLRMVRATIPDLMERIGSARLWVGKETHIEHSLYERLPCGSFSHQVLQARPGNLMVLRLNDIGWSDLGDPGRAVMAAHAIGSDPLWIKKWGLAKGMSVVVGRTTGAVA